MELPLEEAVEEACVKDSLDHSLYHSHTVVGLGPL